MTQAGPSSAPVERDVRSLRILVVTLRYPPYVAGGYELLTRDAVDALRARGHHVTVLAGRGKELESLAHVRPELLPDLDESSDLFQRSFEGSNMERLRLHFLRRANLNATQRAIRACTPDVLFYFNLGLVSLAPILAARRMGIPTLGYVSDPWPLNHWLLTWESQQRKKPLRLAVLRWMWERLRAWVGFGRMFTCSAYLRRSLLQHGLDAEAVSVCHLGVPPDMAERSSAIAEPLRAAREPLRVVCISSFWEGKGQDVLLDAAISAAQDGLEFELVFAGAGSGAYLDRLRTMARDPAVRERVRFLQDLAREDISSLLAGSHVFVLPSVWNEPFALATLEGLAHGLAVIASDAGGTPEALVHGEHGLIVPAGNSAALAEALVTLGGDEELRRRLGRAGKERARTVLSHAAFIDRLEAGLREVMDAPRSAPGRGGA